MKNPLRGLRFSLLDFHSARANTGLKIAMLGISLIPLIYGALYLMAFYDPYGRLDTLPVAVVNEDVPARTSGGELVTAGDDLVAELRESASLDYRLMGSEAEAQAELEAGKVYNTIIIPEDFSACVASADSASPRQARLVMVANESNNYLSSILGASVMRVVTAETNYAIGENYYVQIFDSIDETGSSLAEAADGAATLEDGLAGARDGSATITSNLGTAATGARSLDEGLASAQDGSAAITTNLATAATGATTLGEGISSAQDGSSSIEDGLGTALAGATQLDDGLRQLVGGLATGRESSQTLAAGLAQLQSQGSSQVASGTVALKAALDAKAESLGTLADGSAAVAGGVDQVAALVSPQTVQALGNLEAQVKGYEQTLDQLSAGVETLTDESTGPFALISAQKADIDRRYEAIAGEGGEYAQIGADYATIDAAMAGLAPALGSLGDGVSAAADGVAGVQEAAAQAADLAAGALTTAQGASHDAEAGTYTLSEAQYQALVAQLGGAQGYASGAADGAAGVGDGLAKVGAGVSSATEGLGAVSGAKASIDAHMQAIAGQMDAIDADMATINQIYAGVREQLPSVLATSGSLVSDAQATINTSKELLATAASGAGQVTTLQKGAHQVAAGAAELARSLTTAGVDESGNPTLYAAVATLQGGTAEVDRNLTLLAAGARQLTDQGWVPAETGATQLGAGASQLTGGLGQLYAGSQALTSGLATAGTGAQSLTSGLGQLYAGSQTLSSGLVTAKAGSSELASGLTQLRDGSATLTDGLVTAEDGSSELASGLADGVGRVTEATAGSDAKAAMMSQPVVFEQDNYTSVANYGSGFAPYFIALGLWVGSLVMTFLLRPLNQRLVSGGASPVVAAFSGLVPWLILGTVQALLLAVTIQFACGIHVAHPLAYYLLTVLASWVFCAIIQAIAAALGFPGKFLAVVLLMLQLTTAAGTFPIETEFRVFQVLSPYLPMTYVVHALRQAMAGADLSLVGADVAALGIFALGAFALTSLVARRKRLVTMMDLHPLVDL